MMKRKAIDRKKVTVSPINNSGYPSWKTDKELIDDVKSILISGKFWTVGEDLTIRKYLAVYERIIKCVIPSVKTIKNRFGRWSTFVRALNTRVNEDILLVSPGKVRKNTVNLGIPWNQVDDEEISDIISEFLLLNRIITPELYTKTIAEIAQYMPPVSYVQDERGIKWPRPLLPEGFLDSRSREIMVITSTDGSFHGWKEMTKDKLDDRMKDALTLIPNIRQNEYIKFRSENPDLALAMPPISIILNRYGSWSNMVSTLFTSGEFIKSKVFQDAISLLNELQTTSALVYEQYIDVLNEDDKKYPHTMLIYKRFGKWKNFIEAARPYLTFKF